MKLTEELKRQLAGARNAEEAGMILNNTRKDVEAAGIILDDEDLEQVTGGVRPDVPVITFRPRI